MSKLDELYSQVSEAIERAQAYEDQGAHFAVSAMHRRISALEEEIAKELPASTTQGRVARCSAVYSAFRGNQFQRTVTLARAYLAEDLSESDQAEIRKCAGLAGLVLEVRLCR